MMARILIIDDQPYLNELISFDLSLAGHHVSRVENAKDAMTSIRSDNHDVVLLDLFLNGYERWDLLHRLKLQDRRRPILIVTIDEEIVNDPRLAEANGCVIKEIYAEKVIKKIEDVLNLQAKKQKR
jgi:two-component system phosphate regulon response regulator PhoB